MYSQYYSYHVDINIDTIIAAITDLFGVATGLKPKFKVHGGSYAENIALQNIQVGKNLAFEQTNDNPRRACVCCFHIFSLNCFHGCVVEWVVYWSWLAVTWTNGWLLCPFLFGSNLSLSLRGYLTKYDCSSADLNPIGSISKTDLKRFIGWAQTEFDLPILEQ